MTRRSRRATNGRSPACSASSIRAQLQRGFKVYKEVCQNCHGLKLLSFRNLADPGGPGFSVAQAATIAAEYKVQDGPNDQGEMFERNGRLGRPLPAADDMEERGAGAPALQRHGAARHVGARQGARLRARLPAVPRRCAAVLPVSGARRRLHRGAAEGLQGQAAGRLHASGGRQLQRILPEPFDRDAAAADRRPRRLHRRHAARRSISRPRTSRPS